MSESRDLITRNYYTNASNTTISVHRPMLSSGWQLLSGCGGGGGSIAIVAIVALVLVLATSIILV